MRAFRDNKRTIYDFFARTLSLISAREIGLRKMTFYSIPKMPSAQTIPICAGGERKNRKNHKTNCCRFLAHSQCFAVIRQSTLKCGSPPTPIVYEREERGNDDGKWREDPVEGLSINKLPRLGERVARESVVPFFLWVRGIYKMLSSHSVDEMTLFRHFKKYLSLEWEPTLSFPINSH